MTVIPRAWIVAVLLLGACTAAHAVQIYRCIARDGAVSYQDKPCPPRQKQATVSLQDAPMVSSVPASGSSSPAPAPAPSVAMPMTPLPAPAPLPAMYACTRYDDQRQYLSDTLPGPYTVPMGVLGAPGKSLDQAYGGPDRLGMSAPGEARKPTVGGPLLANAYVQVQDDCHPASPAQVCEELQRRFDANHRKLKMAFPSEQPPLQQREDQLHAQMQGC
ncbi:MAG: DUF4124 domain-containing protein [Proteobacteria bacterium]|nr:DUF4124 domain-containing protein [Pseudomonadota bacterium]